MKIAELFLRKLSVEGLNVPYIIADAGLKHAGGLELSQTLAQAAADAGADAIKFESFPDGPFVSLHFPACADGDNLTLGHEHGQNHDSCWKKEFEQLKTCCDKAGIAFLATPFDAESALFLNDLMDAFKISSADLTNMPFIKFICGFGKPIILSTGEAWLHEIAEAVEWVEQCGNSLALLHSAPDYPLSDDQPDLGMIPALMRVFPGHVIGYSDHAMARDMQNLVTATLLGAKIIEKNFTHDKNLSGNDSSPVMDMCELRHFYDRIRNIIASIGSFEIRAPIEAARKNARRSLAAIRPIGAGQRITGADLGWKREAHGISLGHIDEVIGMTARTDIAAGAILQWANLEN